MQTFILSAAVAIVVLVIGMIVLLSLLLRAQRTATQSQQIFNAQSSSIQSEVGRLVNTVAGEIGKTVESLQRLCGSLELSGRANSETAAKSTEAFRNTVAELDRVLSDNLDKMQTRFEASSKQMGLVAERFQLAVAEHTKAAEENLNRQQAFVTETASGAVRESGQQFAKAADVMRKQIQDTQEMSRASAESFQAAQDQAIQRLHQVADRFQRAVDQHGASVTENWASHEEMIENTGRHWGNAIDGGMKDFKGLVKDQQTLVEKQIAALRGEVAGVTAALLELKASLEEAVKF